MLLPASWPMWLQCAVAFVTSCGTTAILTPVVRQLAIRQGMVARPADDRWKRRVVGKLGGIALYLGIVCGVLFAAGKHAGMLPVFLIGISLMFGMGLLDDLLHIKPSTKLIAQVITACVLLLLGVRIELIPLMWLSIPVALLWILLMTNAINLLDNMDGVAAGVVGIASIFLAIHAHLSGDRLPALLSSAIGGASLGFLWFNVPPAKIFMGDCGSQMLGIALAIATLLGSWRHSTQLLATLALPTLLLSVPIFDTLFVTWTRTLHGRRIFQGGTDHVSHRLAILGLSEWQVLSILYGLSVLFGIVSLVSIRMTSSGFLVILLTALALCLVVGAYLAKVRVYHFERVAASAAPGSSRTILHTMLLYKRQVLEVCVDLLLIVASYVAAHLLRFEGHLDHDVEQLIFRSLPIVISVKLGMFFIVGLYRGIWRYVSIADLVTITKAAVLGSVGAMVALVYLWRFEGYSRAVFIIDGVLVFLGIGAVRVAERLLNDVLVKARTADRRAIIVGAGDAGELLLRELRNNRSLPYHVIGFVDDDPNKIGHRIHGIPVLGPRTALSDICEQRDIEEILVALPTMPLTELRRFVQPWLTKGLHVRLMSPLLREVPELLAE